MTSQLTVEGLLASCTLRVDVDDVPRGTAFFIAPEYALSAAHVVNGAQDASVRLTGYEGSWAGHVADVRPPSGIVHAARADLYPPPDLALIRVGPVPGHGCVLLGHARPQIGARIMARGYSRPLGGTQAPTAETESFTVTGQLDTPGSAGSMLKLGLGQAVPGMSGAPALDLASGEVAGLLRTSRDVGSNLGAWVVGAEVIRLLWPAETAAGDDFHGADDSWRRAQATLASSAPCANPGSVAGSGGSVSIGSIEAAGPVTVFTGGCYSDVNIAAPPASRKKGS